MGFKQGGAKVKLAFSTTLWWSVLQEGAGVHQGEPGRGAGRWIREVALGIRCWDDWDEGRTGADPPRVGDCLSQAPSPHLRQEDYRVSLCPHRRQQLPPCPLL